MAGFFLSNALAPPKRSIIARGAGHFRGRLSQIPAPSESAQDVPRFIRLATIPGLASLCETPSPFGET